MKSLTALVVGAALLSIANDPARAQQPSGSVSLPSASQKEFLEQLRRPERTAPAAIERAPVRAMPPDSIHVEALRRRGQVDQPLHARDQAYVLLDPALTPDEVRATIAQYKLRVLDASPQIGGLLVDVSEVPVTGPRAPDPGAGFLAVSPAIEELRKDPKFLAVTPNSVVTPHQIAPSLVHKVPASPPPSTARALAPLEVTDWGMNDAKIAAVWGQLSGQTFEEGVIDVGFAAHEDIAARAALVQNMPSNNHGNHVAGIICARHNNKGLKGVLPNCTAAISTGSFVLDLSDPIENVNTQFYGMFAELVATVLEFVDKNAGVKNINLSLGYNWMPNFNINPVDPQQTAARDLVRQQGVIFLRILAFARQRDIAIISAAGNDSGSLATPTLAKWSSPFNWAALTMRELDGWSNGIVVEAHDRNSRRAGFSNVGGNISAPGVDIYSAVAGGGDAYGTMSGTSMASPHVAGAIAALRRLRPNRSLREAIDCLLSSPSKTNVGTPKLDLTHALATCPA
jgi:subtilisin family serine protease